MDVCDVPEEIIAADPAHSVQPVKLIQALQAVIEAIAAHVGEIVRNVKRALTPDQNGSLQPVVGEGGRQCMQQLIVVVHRTARSFDEKVQASVHKALGNTDVRLSVCPLSP